MSGCLPTRTPAPLFCRNWNQCWKTPPPPRKGHRHLPSRSSNHHQCRRHRSRDTGRTWPQGHSERPQLQLQPPAVLWAT